MKEHQSYLCALGRRRICQPYDALTTLHARCQGLWAWITCIKSYLISCRSISHLAVWDSRHYHAWGGGKV